MEFYLSKRCEISYMDQFQFPTGWNSTQGITSEAAQKWVSIPNGMEFYSLPPPIWKVCTNSFNSQRDGILQTAYDDHYSVPLLFQFPTGWNSTLTFFSPRARIYRSFNSQRDGILRERSETRATWLNSFNSQRDGILHCAYSDDLKEFQFQFPTGWNSTQTLRKNIGGFAVVSIPNGMEFYGHPHTPEFVFPRFNSQRDGILPGSVVKSAFGKWSVSIPNGMEFYVMYKLDISLEQ